MTFLGIAIWLAVDNLFWPIRSDMLLRSNVLVAISNTKSFLDASAQTLKTLVDVDESEINLRNNNNSDLFEQCTRDISNLTRSIETQQKCLSLLAHEPQFLKDVFPIRSYERLVDVFKRLLRVGRATNTSLVSLRKTLQQMPSSIRNIHNTLFTFMNAAIFSLAQKAHVALELASDALTVVYDYSSSTSLSFSSSPDEAQDNLTALLTLSRGVVKVKNDINQHVRNTYAKKIDEISTLSPSFLWTWHNVFDSFCDLMDTLQALGASLYDVQHSEKKRNE